ncbi:hypothetical protein PsorP6_001781 [Peronosclerospora sorghi]|uniref:Uncharacterized protein n=1 Tax=Peronosclerospora sorghi TaxID=230839 RepID=A0ACC0WYU5_9STRA|nr:hypothetical protein PsorP6_001781 [Peronosclerospora sorghi]
MPQSSDSVSVATFKEDAPAAAAPMFGAQDTFADAKAVASSQLLVTSSQHASGTPAATASVEQVQSASRFGTPAGVDVRNPFDANRASIATKDARQIEEHELRTRDTGDLFGSSSCTTGFPSSFPRPTSPSSSMYQTHNEISNQVESGSQRSADSVRTQSTHTTVQARGMQIATCLDTGNSSQLDGEMQAATNSRLNTIRSTTASNHLKQQPHSSAHTVLHGANQSSN